MISGGQLKRTGTTDEPAPTEVAETETEEDEAPADLMEALRASVEAMKGRRAPRSRATTRRGSSSVKARGSSRKPRRASSSRSRR